LSVVFALDCIVHIPVTDYAQDLFKLAFCYFKSEYNLSFYANPLHDLIDWCFFGQNSESIYFTYKFTLS